MTFGDRAKQFFSEVELSTKLPRGVEVMNPYLKPEVLGGVNAFYDKFFVDNNQRVSLWGINPGRHGSGTTGISFTDPHAVREFLKIKQDTTGPRELSSRFIYQVVDLLGGPEQFYSQFYINSLSPLGFLKFGKNYNFYDDVVLNKLVTPFILETMKKQIDFGLRRDVAVSLGSGKLYQIFQKLNQEHGFFGEIIPLEHPRFIMQYKRQEIPEYEEKYAQTLKGILDK